MKEDTKIMKLKRKMEFAKKMMEEMMSTSYRLREGVSTFLLGREIASGYLVSWCAVSAYADHLLCFLSMQS